MMVSTTLVVVVELASSIFAVVMFHLQIVNVEEDFLLEKEDCKSLSWTKNEWNRLLICLIHIEYNYIIGMNLGEKHIFTEVYCFLCNRLLISYNKNYIIYLCNA